MNKARQPEFGTGNLRLPDELREPLQAHLEDLRQRYREMGWGGRVGFGLRPALIVIDLARFWTEPDHQMGSDIDAVVEASCSVLDTARSVGIPIFFTTTDYDPADPPSPRDGKLVLNSLNPDVFDLDARLDRRPTEKIVRKKYASAFKSTNLHEMLTAAGVDTLIVTGVSTSHCIYATCRDATDSFRVIIPAEAVGERCEIMHEVNLLDIDIDLGDVMPLAAVVECLKAVAATTRAC
jgi:nicotinamidase-related amidase